MKKLLFFLFLLSSFHLFSQDRIRFGLRAGLSTYNLESAHADQNDFSISVKDAKYGYHLGIFARGHIGERFYFQPELLFNSNTVDFTVNDLSDNLVDKVLDEKYQNLDIPVMLGWKLGPLRLQGGPVGHLHIASSSELDAVDGYKQKFSNFNLGYQAGVGLDIWRFLFDLRYEGNFTKFGDHMTVGGEEIKFSKSPARWVLSAGFSF
jgi:hypothetical protein